MIAQPNLVRHLGLVGILCIAILLQCGGINLQRLSSVNIVRHNKLLGWSIQACHGKLWKNLSTREKCRVLNQSVIMRKIKKVLLEQGFKLWGNI